MSNTNGFLSKKILIEGVITARTGLHIGGTNLGMSIGGADATVVRNPLNNQPYIPGSSLKGKMRSLLEKLEGKFGGGQDANIKASPYTEVDEDHVSISKIFGTIPEKMKEKRQPTSRIIVRDCLMTKDTLVKLEKAKNTDMPYTEVKTEVVIDRITSAATPRQMERVPAGAEFDMSIVVNIYEDDDEKGILQKVFRSLTLVQNDYLGGKGTRGSGQVDIAVTKLQYKDKSHYEDLVSWQNYTGVVEIPQELNK
ncbi:MAG: type III-A CRISPR-associated RAMP protein Csm3 [Saprospiraceae bacterium]|nr:type III-A CRISPR-associated RAMP protein Csm3 [Saprospiraceae bacterium]